MIYKLLKDFRKYRGYVVEFDCTNKMLIFYTPIKVKDLMELKQMIKQYKLDLEIRVIER